MRRAIFLAFFAIVAILSVDNAEAELRLHGLFTDHAVLQRGEAVPVWGWADDNLPVTVTLGKQIKTATPADDGSWRVELDALAAGGPHLLSVKQGDATIERKDLYIGEVWLCSGQSNMAMKVAASKDAKEEIAAADWPQIRMFNVPRSPADKPQSNVKGSWHVCSPQTVGGFSATAYYFGRKLHKELGVPVGLINSSVGGTPIEAWTSLATHEGNEHLKPILKQASDGAGKSPGQLYNGMIAPLAPYTVRGAIWYQGERNSKIGQPFRYRYQLPAMIGNWRELWGTEPEGFTFIFVQLPGFMAAQTKPVETDGWVLVREGMHKTLTASPNTGMAVTLDVGDARDIHPKNKQAVGARLALWALGTTYDKSLVYSGPLVKSYEIKGSEARITFDHVGGGLAARDGQPLVGFAMAGEDESFVWADAKIEGQDTVVVSNREIKKPAAVRYAWAANPKANLINKEGLPAAPFRTDDWDE